MTLATGKRFYEAAGVEDAEGGFALVLDGRMARTPAGLFFVAPTRTLAEAVAAEWDAQSERIEPHRMPLTRLLSTALDRIPATRAEVVDQISIYAETDLLCYRAEKPDDLVVRQEAAWRHMLDWAAERHGARLRVTQGVLPVEQPAEALRALKSAVEAVTDLELAGLAVGTAAAGSLVIGLALLEGVVVADGAFEAAEVDATFQIERWGEDDEARERRQRLLDDFRAVERFVTLSRG